MFEYAGHITHVEPPLTPLGLIPLAPLLAAAVLALFSLRGKRPPARQTNLLGLGSTLLALTLTLANAGRLASLAPERRALHDFAWNLLRIGSLDASLAFHLDPLAAALLIPALIAFAFLQWRAAKSLATDPTYHRLAASTCLLLGSLSLLLLGDNAVVMLVGWGGVSLATYLLINARFQDPARVSAGTRALLQSRAADLGLLSALVLLFWSLGGAWIGESGYLSDYRPRFVAVHDEGRLPAADEDEHDEEDAARDPTVPREIRDPRLISKRASAKGYLTLTSYPGARVHLGIADLGQLAQSPPVFGTSPFVRKEISAGVHPIVIIPGGGATIGGDGNEVAWIERVNVAEGEEVVLAPIGSTLTFREIDDQLALRDAEGKAFLKDALTAKRWGSVDLVTLVCLLLFVGVAAIASLLPLFGWLAEPPAGRAHVAALMYVAIGISAVYPLARLRSLLALSPTSGTVLMVMIAIGAVIAFATRAKGFPAGRRITEAIVEAAAFLARAAVTLADRLDDLLLDRLARALTRGAPAEKPKPPSPPEASS